MSFRELEKSCESRGLRIFAAFHPEPADRAPEGCRTLLLLGPHEPGFWALVSAAPEFFSENPVDQWSARVIGALAHDFNARAVFPFGGPPHHPFVAWALKSGCVDQSPVGLLVHPQAGLFVSFRGALAFDRHIDLPKPMRAQPCNTCPTKPCLTACPAQALTAAGYDVGSCHSFLDQSQGESCLNRGCLVRQSCPANRCYDRLSEQSAHHMSFFHKKVST